MTKHKRARSNSPEIHPENDLDSRRLSLKAELDRIYYTLPYDEVQPVLSQLKDTVECLNEMGEAHQSRSSEHPRRHTHRRAA